MAGHVLARPVLDNITIKSSLRQLGEKIEFNCLQPITNFPKGRQKNNVAFLSSYGLNTRIRITVQLVSKIPSETQPENKQTVQRNGIRQRILGGIFINYMSVCGIIK